MKFKRQLAAFGGALALVTAGASVALVGGMTDSHAASVPSSAFGLEATGLIAIPATPAVSATKGTLVTDSLIALPSNPVITGGVVNVQAQNGAAEADVANLAVGGGLVSQLSGVTAQLGTALQPACDALNSIGLTAVNNAVGGVLGQLGAVLNQLGGQGGINLSLVAGLDLSNLLPDQLGGLCDVLKNGLDLVSVGAVTTECHGNAGSVQVTGLKALGLPISASTAPNSSVSIPGVLTITINKQTKNSDGTFTVDGLYIDLLGQQQIIATSATCGNVPNKVTPVTSPTSDAPTPTPTHTNAPVTG